MKYKIEGWYTQNVGGTYTIEVEAASEAEAIEKAKQGLHTDIYFTEKWSDSESCDLDDDLEITK